MSTMSIQSLAQEWLRLDRNPETRKEIETLLNNSDEKELQKRFEKRMEFGTAGLRAAMGAGFSRMNELTVIQATQGLAKYLIETVPNVQDKGVVIGHDHRHHSNTFARLAAAVFLSLNIKVWFYRKLVHTPLVPYGVKKLGAGAGIMITASHNPKQDNGYKVYWENACQIIPPHDAGIAASIEQNLEPWTWDANLVSSHSLALDPETEGIIDAYFEDVKALCRRREHNEQSDLKFVYTAMHGVGTPYARRSFEAFGFKPFIEVPEQVEPDPDFPTVAFPNPEEGKGALTLAIRTADAHGARLILANDPDADRLAIAEKLPSGEWKVFSGNQIGSILGAAVFRDLKAEGKPLDKTAMLASTVSSKMLRRMAEVEGFLFDETLTGFKWIGNRAIDLQRNEGIYVAFAYEEAIGFTIGDIVYDKDGVSTAAFFAEFAVRLDEEGSTAMQYLEGLYRKYGYFITDNSYFYCYDQDVIRNIFDRIRFGEEKKPSDTNHYTYKLAYPTHVGGRRVTTIRDLTIGYDSTTSDKKPRLAVSSSSQMITFSLENGCVFTLRTSGTEPKIKYYIELSGPDEEQVQRELARIVQAVAEELLQPVRNGLGYRKAD